MKKILSTLRQPEFLGVLFLACLILFTRPKLLMPNTALPGKVMASFFLPWAIVIVILFLVNLSYRGTAPEEGQDSESKNRK